ncbi:MAG: GNAT family N-acetyltransferase [Bacteroidota bacterium]
MEQKKQRESETVRIVSFEPAYREAFRLLNEAWIREHFTLEDMDRQSLENPESYILDPGGAIIFAVYEGKVVGTCALIKMDDPDYDYELAKMAVDPTVQGKGIGYLLGKAILERAKEMGADKVYLESNTKLPPAINLYHKLGFKRVSGRPSPYERCNIQMDIDLTGFGNL